MFFCFPKRVNLISMINLRHNPSENGLTVFYAKTQQPPLIQRHWKHPPQHNNIKLFFVWKNCFFGGVCRWSKDLYMQGEWTRSEEGRTIWEYQMGIKTSWLAVLRLLITWHKQKLKCINVRSHEGLYFVKINARPFSPETIRLNKRQKRPSSPPDSRPIFWSSFGLDSFYY